MMLILRVDAAGSIPTWVVNKKVAQYLSAVQEVINEFRQDKMVDEEDKKGLIGVMRDEWMNQVYSAEEEALIKQVCHMLEGSLKEESWIVWTMSMLCDMRRKFDKEMSLVRVDEDTIIILKMPLKDEGQDMARNSVLTLSRASSALRGRHTFQTGNIIEAICLVRLGNDMTRVDCALKLEVGAGISQRTVLALIEKRLDEISEASIYFQRLVPLSEYVYTTDGQALAQDLLYKAPSSKKRVERLHEILQLSRGFKELVKVHPWLKLMLLHSIKGSLNVSVVSGHSKLECVSEEEAIRVGKNFVPALMTEQMAETASFGSEARRWLRIGTHP
ncbi:hypothetical protein TrST_g12212 [Triparma strigata]|uniref:Uncharacterized protein n=1 Tax=Triparma strigata TaxID=1606541 RepID=A0A9W7ELY0_9STRA|nr:hypothetical protein TrST_g12212 [Triparma strigata]